MEDCVQNYIDFMIRNQKRQCFFCTCYKYAHPKHPNIFSYTFILNHSRYTVNQLLSQNSVWKKNKVKHASPIYNVQLQRYDRLASHFFVGGTKSILNQSLNNVFRTLVAKQDTSLQLQNIILSNSITLKVVWHINNDAKNLIHTTG